MIAVNCDVCTAAGSRACHREDVADNRVGDREVDVHNKPREAEVVGVNGVVGDHHAERVRQRREVVCVHVNSADGEGRRRAAVLARTAPCVGQHNTFFVDVVVVQHKPDPLLVHVTGRVAVE